MIQVMLLLGHEANDTFDDACHDLYCDTTLITTGSNAITNTTIATTTALNCLIICMTVCGDKG